MIYQSLLFAIFLLIQISISTDSIPLLDEKINNNSQRSSWSLTENAENHLMKFKDELVHVIAIGGPTRAGKSFIMSSMLEKFTGNGGTVCFGTFVHRKQMKSVTKGMDIALVKYENKFILLIDCEGLDSVTKTMDPVLMIIMAMISQKMIYLNGTFDTHTIENISTMITNRNRACDTKGIPLDTMYFILNKYGLERKDNFLQEKLNTEEYFDIKEIIDDAFPKQKTFFVCAVKSGQKSKDRFAQDIELIFENISSNIKPFALKGTELTIGNFVKYLRGALDQINNNKEISFPNVLQATYEQFARNKYCELEKGMKPCTEYLKEHNLKSRLLEIEGKKEEFCKECDSYKNQISDLYEEFVRKFEDFQRKFEEDNENIGKEIETTEVTTRKEQLKRDTETLQQEKSGFMGGLSTGSSIGSCGGVVGSIGGGLVGGIGGLIFGGEKEVKVEKITYAVFQVTTITLKNGTKSKDEKRLEDIVQTNQI